MSDLRSSLWLADQLGKKSWAKSGTRLWQKPLYQGASQARAAIPFLQSFAGNTAVKKLLGAVKTPVTRRFAGPVLGGTLGTTADLAEGMNPVQAFGRNIAGTTAGVFAFPFAEVALPMVPGSGIAGYIGADQLGRRGFDQLYGLATEGSKDAQTGGFLGGPLPNVDDYLRDFEEEGAIEREENEWGPGGQPTASEQTRIYEQSGWRNSPRYENSPAARSGAFTEGQLGRQKQLHDDFKEAQRSGTMEEFVRQYPQSQTAKEYAIRRRIPSSLDMEF